MQPNDARQGQGHRLPNDSVCPSPSNDVLRLTFFTAQALRRLNTAASPRLQHASSLLASLFQLALAICKYLIIHSGTDTNSINTNSVVNTHLRCHDRLSAARAAHTRANSLLVVELRGDCGWTAWSAHRQDEEPCTLLRSCTTHALAPHVLRAGSGPRAPLLLRESTRIKGDKAGIRKQRPHATVASPPSVRPRHVRRTS